MIMCTVYSHFPQGTERQSATRRLEKDLPPNAPVRRRTGDTEPRSQRLQSTGREYL